MKKTLYLFLCMALLLSLLPGCGRETAPSSPAVQTDAAASPESTHREIEDWAGRTVKIPNQIDSVFSANSASAIYLYTLAPDLLLGWNYELNDIEKSIIPEQYHSLPNFGQKDAINYEAVIAANPSIVLNVGTINDKMVSECDSLQERLGIPVIAVDGDLELVPQVYRFLGQLLGVDAEPQAAYAEKALDEARSLDIPEEHLVRVYYGNGEDSLETAPRGSSHGQILDLTQAVNVADLELGDGARVQISPEQLLAWDPDVIVVIGEAKASLSGSSAAEKMMADPLFSDLTAVRNGTVFGVPNAPFSWVDRPPGPNRIIGIRWLSGLLYPQYVSFQVDTEVREFFKIFYHVELTDQQLEKLYHGSI